MLIMLIIVKYINYFIRNVFTKLIFYILMAEFVNRFLNMKNIKKKTYEKNPFTVIYFQILTVSQVSKKY